MYGSICSSTVGLTLAGLLLNLRTLKYHRSQPPLLPRLLWIHQLLTHLVSIGSCLALLGPFVTTPYWLKDYQPVIAVLLLLILIMNHGTLFALMVQPYLLVSSLSSSSSSSSLPSLSPPLLSFSSAAVPALPLHQPAPTQAARAPVPIPHWWHDYRPLAIFTLLSLAEFGAGVVCSVLSRTYIHSILKATLVHWHSPSQVLTGSLAVLVNLFLLLMVVQQQSGNARSSPPAGISPTPSPADGEETPAGKEKEGDNDDALAPTRLKKVRRWPRWNGVRWKVRSALPGLLALAISTVFWILWMTNVWKTYSMQLLYLNIAVQMRITTDMWVVRAQKVTHTN
ncbi:hypothetical protein H4R33_005030 [Dimargaris cristalligena]|nr:hypothetical protein H4R33_005030 [Dimargaris cristalligena]